MDKRFLLELLQKHDTGRSTPEEELLLENYYNLFETEPDGLLLLSEEDKAALKAVMYNAISQRISAAGPGYKKIRIIRMPLMMKMAVVASLLVACITAFHLYHVPSKTKPALLAAGRKKENRLLCLPDGSKVIVGWNSTFYCSPSFGSGRREVYLEGQAYFDIAHNPAKPFVVHTGKLETTVLGTAFTITAIPGEEEITVTVTRGKVKISKEKKVLGLLTPGKQMIFYKKADSSVQKPAEVAGIPDWKKQDLLVNNITVEQAARLLEERFHVSIAIQDSVIGSNRFTTVFLASESLEQILKSICEFNDAVYRYKEKDAVIISKNKSSTN